MGVIFESLDPSVRTHPEIAAVLVVMFGALVLVVYAAIRFKRPMGTCFAEALEGVDEITALMYLNPDPDVMAAAIGVAYLAEQIGTIPTIQSVGRTRHQENRALRTVLDLDLDPIDHVSDPVAEAAILVGHNEPCGFVGAEGILPHAAVDHHPGDGTGEAFIDVRTDYDTCSSIVAEYFRDVGAKPVPPDVHASEVNASYTVPSQVATSFVYEILMDTKYLTVGCSAANFDAAGFLLPGVNEDHLNRIASPEVSREVLETKVRIIAGRGVRDPFAVADIGAISNVDAIPQTTDELIQLEGVITAVVCGERESNVYLSGRPRDDRVHMGRTLEATPDHYRGSSAGGHAWMGSGRIIRPDAVTDGGNDEFVPCDELIEHIFEAFSGDI